MKLLLRRDQKSGMLSSAITFTLEVRAELTEQESQNIKKYKLGKTMLYERLKVADPGSGLIGVAWRLAVKAINLTISVDDLMQGKRVDCKDIVEMLAVMEQIKEAAQTFKIILEAAAHFGGEEVLEF